MLDSSLVLGLNHTGLHLALHLRDGFLLRRISGSFHVHSQECKCLGINKALGLFICKLALGSSVLGFRCGVAGPTLESSDFKVQGFDFAGKGPCICP